MIDAAMLKYRPSVIAIACVSLGFQLEFELQMNAKPPTLEITTQEGKEKVA